MTILVTGSTGLLGSAVLDALTATGRDVVGLRSADGDLRDPVEVEAIFHRHRPSVVYHIAARVHGLAGNTAFPAEMFLDNIRINTNVIDAARRFGCNKFVAASTVAAYPDGLPMPIAETALWDGPPHGSEKFYAHAKRVMFAQLESCQIQYGLDFSYAILTNLYGPRDRFDVQHGHVVPSLIAKFFAAAREGGAVEVWGTGVAQRDFLYAEDAAAALVAIGEHGSGAYNVATGTTVPIRRVVEILANVSDVSDVRWDASKPNGQLERSYDVTKLAGLGFAPRHSLEQGLRATYEWYVENHEAARR